MKITTFNPQIITKNGEKIKELFEELGFEVRHDRKEIGAHTSISSKLRRNCL